jgi:hypothetical protein
MRRTERKWGRKIIEIQEGEGGMRERRRRRRRNEEQ